MAARINLPACYGEASEDQAAQADAGGAGGVPDGWDARDGQVYRVYLLPFEITFSPRGDIAIY
ncbi:MAG: hypothetical protein ABIK12_10555, partial [Pseudomonadota bacterium]